MQSCTHILNPLCPLRMSNKFILFIVRGGRERSHESVRGGERKTKRRGRERVCEREGDREGGVERGIVRGREEKGRHRRGGRESVRGRGGYRGRQRGGRETKTKTNNEEREKWWERWKREGREGKRGRERERGSGCESLRRVKARFRSRSFHAL
jgi:hypothetical protein